MIIITTALLLNHAIKCFAQTLSAHLLLVMTQRANIIIIKGRRQKKSRTQYVWHLSLDKQGDIEKLGSLYPTYSIHKFGCSAHTN